MATTDNPNASAIPNKPMPVVPLAPDITADPHPKSTRQNVPNNSAVNFLISIVFRLKCFCTRLTKKRNGYSKLRKILAFLANKNPGAITPGFNQLILKAAMERLNS
jgi:hypothetical protein